MSETAIHVREGDVAALDAAKLDLFGTDQVPYRAVILRLLADHDDVEYSGSDG